jgi:ankyrin repeat protein
MIASENGHSAVVEILVANGADFNITNKPVYLIVMLAML